MFKQNSHLTPWKADGRSSAPRVAWMAPGSFLCPGSLLRLRFWEVIWSYCILSFQVIVSVFFSSCYWLYNLSGFTLILHGHHEKFSPNRTRQYVKKYLYKWTKSTASNRNHSAQVKVVVSIYAWFCNLLLRFAQHLNGNVCSFKRYLFVIISMAVTVRPQWTLLWLSVSFSDCSPF